MEERATGKTGKCLLLPMSDGTEKNRPKDHKLSLAEVIMTFKVPRKMLFALWSAQFLLSGLIKMIRKR